MNLIRKTLNVIAATTGVVVVSDFLPRGRNPFTDSVLPLEGRRQVEDFSCGFVAALMVVEYFNRPVTVDRLYRLIGPHEEWGASTRKVATALRRCGIRVGLRDALDFDGLAAAIEAGHPVITCIKEPGVDDSHWCVAYGISRKPRRVFVAGVGLPHLDDGKVLPWGTFAGMWTPRGNGMICSMAQRTRKISSRR